MTVVVQLVGFHSWREVVWPDGWPLPPAGATIHLGNGELAQVKSVGWYPQGSAAGPLVPHVLLILEEITYA